MATDRRGESNSSNAMHVGEDKEPHFLRPITSTTIPQNLVFVDCESTSEPIPNRPETAQRLRLGVAISVRRENGRWARRHVFHFTDPIEFWGWIIQKIQPKRPLWLFAHNLAVDAVWIDVFGRVDDKTLTISSPCEKCGFYEKGQCKEHRYFRGAAVMTDPPVIFCFKSNRGVIRMIDTMNYWKTSVASLGAGLGLPKIEMPHYDEAIEKWFTYCERDCEIVEKTVCNLMDVWEKEECGHWESTAAGLAWSAFRKTMPAKSIVVDHREPHTAMERAAYYGGQAEAYYTGLVKEPVTMLDVRSLYPAMMQSQEFPIAYCGHEVLPNMRTVIARMRIHTCIASVIVRTEGSGYPKRIKANKTIKEGGIKISLKGQVVFEPDRLAFPVGEYHTYLAGPELQRAIDRDEIVQIKSIAWYRSGQPFTEFVDRWYAKRPLVVTPENIAQDMLAKTILNSLSGKFAQHKMRWVDMPLIRAQKSWGQWFVYDAEKKAVRKFRAIGGYVQELTDGGEGRDAVCAISAYITAYGREYMRSVREFCPPNSVYYQDTDSLMVNNEALAALDNRGLVGTGELGKLRIIGFYDKCHIYAVKDYEADGKAVISGVKKSAKKIGPGIYEQEQWDSLANTLSRPPDGIVKIRPTVLRLNRERFARHRGSDGWTFPPRLIGDEEIPF